MRAHRNQRALAVIRHLRLRQKKQNLQIELLCRDMVEAHGQFARKLSRLSFVSQFYETLLSSSNIESLLDAATGAIQARVSGSNVAIFLLESNGFDIHFIKDPKWSPLSVEQVEGWFSTETVRDISMSSQVCGVERLLELGMQANPKELKQIAAAAVPLGALGQASGFTLLWRQAEKPFTKSELETIASVAGGLRYAIRSRSKGTEPVSR